MNIAAKIRNVFAARQNPVERYLNEATSVLDLEMRQREIDSGRFGTRRYR